jgi:hypothetical protein
VIAIGEGPVAFCPWCALIIQEVVDQGPKGRFARPCGHPLADFGAIAEHHRFLLPYPVFPKYPALSPNLRGNRWATNAHVQAVRADVSRICRPIRPGCKHLTVHLAWRPPRLNSQDDDNLLLLYKAVCDALARGARRPTLQNRGANIGLDLVPGDTRRHMTKLMPVVLPSGPPGMWLTVLATR